MADWAVETWAIALGVVPLPSSPNPIQAPPVLIKPLRRDVAPAAVPLPTLTEWLLVVMVVGLVLVAIFLTIFMLTRTAVVDVKMVLIPAGPFQMGSNQGDSYEKPAHTVTVDAFLMDVYEVTNAEYAQCVADRRCAVPGNLFSSTRKDYYTNPQYANYPVVTVSWDNAKTYCEWRGARLPSEAEWEKAARGGLEGKLYPWGDTPPVCTVGAENGAQFDDCAVGDTVAVGSFKPNGYGLYDMAGNAWEWVNDWWGSGYYSASPNHNPTGPTSGNRKMLRGGGWYGAVEALRTMSRYVSDPATRYNNIGFRCVAAPAR
jgi:formylglycine-generating enzyme required for sulfatase activity